MTPPVALTIAGSDSGGGAGLAADLRTFAALGVHGALAVTTVTAQDTVRVHRAAAVAPDLLADQIDVVLADLPVAAAKTGFLGSPANVEAVADRAGALPHLVVDPVLVAHDGAPILDAVGAYRDRLLPHATVATPNHREAALLLGRDLLHDDDLADAAHALRALGPRWVVITGGALGGPDAVDVVAGPSGTRALRAPRIDTVNTHGSGCSFAAAIAARLAHGDQPDAAIDRAKAFVSAAVAGAATWRLGDGRGPVDHLGWGA
ncbi:MAG TPA: bifunctional hydroxymethylpyrimidine kinase/phosphomethylpyrimidine kinase [Acidimicrobiales bacterium]|nr:bifunctional hydroxymethylpyrimidine kinase/phosphomethylpyrimidine kinase [Acidimicrobiales bacterium]